MDVQKLAALAVKKRFSRSGRRFQGEAIKREIDAAGRPASEHTSFNYPTGSIKNAEHILRLLGFAEEDIK